MIKLKDPSGWFAAGPRMLQALRLLSDGAFKLFAYLCLSADRATGRLPLAQADLARALGKSRNSISAYLEELSRQGLCVIKTAPNQHQPGEIQITDAFWPYHRDAGADTPDREADYAEQVRACLRQFAIVRSAFGPAERNLAAQLCRGGVPWPQLEKALLLGLSRKYIAALNSAAPAPVYSFAYFLPLLDEVAHTDVSDRYWDYLRRRLNDLDAAWRDRYPDASLAALRRPPQPSRPALQSKPGVADS